MWSGKSMFTGIVVELGRVEALYPDQLVVKASQALKKIELGGSVAVNGACLTVTSFDTSTFTVGLSSETIQRTNLGLLKSGDPVNLERPLNLGGELGGHLVQGHVDGVGRLVSSTPAGGSNVMRFEAPAEIMRYLVEKGFIALDGISLTLTARSASYFEVAVIDYTRAHTTLNFRKTGDLINLEVDIIAKYVEQMLQPQQSNITLAFLKENGF
jgi:riboflavin synthase